MKILLISDTHGDLENTKKIIQHHQGVDTYIHLGDIGFAYQELPGFIFIKGNHDAKFIYASEELFYFEKRRILCVHGDAVDKEVIHEIMGMKQIAPKDMMGMYLREVYRKLAAYAKQKNCDTVFFGHTHITMCEEVDGVMLINPGSVCLGIPNCTYATVNIDKNQIQTQIYNVKYC